MTEAPANSETSPPPHFAVIVRACDKVASVHNAGRPFGLTKLETIKVCVYSLIKALDGQSHTIMVIGDGLSDRAVSFFEAFPHLVLRQEQFLDPEKTLRLQIELGLAERDATWVYFCEDDYLHVRGSFERIGSLLAHRDETLDTVGAKRNWLPRIGGNPRDRPLFIHPADYPDRYRRKDRRPVYLFAAPDRHWRQTSHTTHTFMAEARALRRYQADLRASIDGCDDKQLSRSIYGGVLTRGKALCLSPLPGLATHFTDEVMSPYVDWGAEVERNRRELSDLGLW